jgi:hypothetical protein
MSLIATNEMEPGLQIFDLDCMITGQAPIATIEMESGVTHVSYCDHRNGTGIVNFRFRLYDNGAGSYCDH